MGSRQANPLAPLNLISDQALNRIFRSGRPSSIYPFLLRALRAFEEGFLSESAACLLLDTVESFLFRRAVLGIEPTGLHAAFKGLWQELTDDYDGSGLVDGYVSPKAIKEVLSKKATVKWPSDPEFKFACETGELYRRKIAKFAIREYEHALKGESPKDDHQIEHIAPQTPTAEWKSSIGDRYDELVHTWGNLIPLTPTMNPSGGNSSFEKKRLGYKDSIFASAREVGEFSEWSADSIISRSKQIAAWALTRWPY